MISSGRTLKFLSITGSKLTSAVASLANQFTSYENGRHEGVDRELCRIIQESKAGIRPRMVIYSQSLWRLPPDVEINRLSPPQVRDNEFISLRDLLEPNRSNRESLLSSMEGKDRLILSFILATFLLHFYNGPWLQGSLDSDNVCFLLCHRRISPDITKPYLTTSFSSMKRGALPGELNQPHLFPDILSLGILLLEIARGAPIHFEESQDRCVVALECMDKWATTYRIGRFRTIPEGLRRAISACIDPKEFRDNMLDKISVGNFEIRKYIFERILHPLEDALSTAYEIQLNTLHAGISQRKELAGIGSFDHQEEDGREKYEYTCLQAFSSLIPTSSIGKAMLTNGLIT